MENLSFLLPVIKDCLSDTYKGLLSEIRLRNGYPITVLIRGEKKELNDKRGKPIICTVEMIGKIIQSVTENSLYAFNDRLKCGYITTDKGVRIGIAGELVYDSGQVVTIKNFSSLNIRVPHEIKGCSESVFNACFKNGVLNSVLIVSKPFMGKTTMLKDLCFKINGTDKYNVLIVDERGEFYGVSGKNIDIIKYSDKQYAFEYGIRSLSPDVIVTDELSRTSDWESVSLATESGVKVIASCHGDNVDSVLSKKGFKKGSFDYYVELCNSGKAGRINGIYDKDFKKTEL